MKSIPFRLFLLAFLTYGYFFQSGEWNENVKFDQVRAILEDGTFAIDRFASNTGDIASFNGHVYPVKAPGSVFLALPVWTVFKAAFHLIEWAPQVELHWLCYLTSWFTVGGCAALLVALLYLVLYRLTDERNWSIFIALAYAFGTIAFPFSTAYFSHQVSAFFLFGAFAGVFLYRGERRAKRRKILFTLSGFFAGYCLTTEYTTLIGVIPVVIYAALTLDRRKDIPYFLGGLGLGGLFLALYHIALFGSPFTTPYSLLAHAGSAFPEHRLGFMGIQIPNLWVLWKITFGLQRGIFWLNPWLLLLIPAFLMPFVRRQERLEIWGTWTREMLLSCFIVAIFFLVNAGFGTSLTSWGGGSSVGPRHVIGCLPFAALLIGRLGALAWVRRAFVPLAFVSVAIMLVATAVEVRLGPQITNPVFGYYTPAFLRSDFARYPYGIYGNHLLTTNSVAFNWGKLLRLAPYLQLVPLLVFWFWAFARLIAGSRRLVARGNIAVLTFLGVFFLVPLFYQASHGMLIPSPENGGLEGRYYRGELLEAFDERTDFPSRDLFLVRTDPQIFFTPGDSNFSFITPFYVEWNAVLRITRSGVYTFGARVHGGLQIWVDGIPVVDGLDGFSEARPQGEINLEEGTYRFKVRFAASRPNPELILFWIEPDGRERFVPSFVLVPS